MILFFKTISPEFFWVIPPPSRKVFTLRESGEGKQKVLVLRRTFPAQENSANRCLPTLAPNIPGSFRNERASDRFFAWRCAELKNLLVSNKKPTRFALTQVFCENLPGRRLPQIKPRPQSEKSR